MTCRFRLTTVTMALTRNGQLPVAILMFSARSTRSPYARVGV
jgi:hypothetical protein